MKIKWERDYKDKSILQTQKKNTNVKNCCFRKIYVVIRELLRLSQNCVSESCCPEHRHQFSNLNFQSCSFLLPDDMYLFENNLLIRKHCFFSLMINMFYHKIKTYFCCISKVPVLLTQRFCFVTLESYVEMVTFGGALRVMGFLVIVMMGSWCDFRIWFNLSMFTLKFLYDEDYKTYSFYIIKMFLL